MQFGLSESQQILKDTARKFFAGESPLRPYARPWRRKQLMTPLSGQSWPSRLYWNHCTGRVRRMGLRKVELILLMEEAGYAMLPDHFSQPWRWLDR